VHYTSAKPWKGYAIQFDKWWDYYIHLPESLKQQMEVSKKAHKLYNIWKTPIVGQIFQGLLKAKDTLTTLLKKK